MPHALIVGDDDQEIRQLVAASSPILGAETEYLAVEVDPSSTDPLLAWGTAHPLIRPLQRDHRSSASAVDRPEYVQASEATAQPLSADGDTSSAVIDAARRLGVDVIVVAARQQGVIAKFFNGSAAEDLVQTSPIPVLTVNLHKQDPAP